eukprot:TRINITY_DN25615_c0_g1_i6.p1 TRINITY_DN25615_c0_g1~~TRINITY_DN25615_c0_g1_i6.p1  ORF type:complete len:148 (+),score=8.76 TRINITY_DN25615_c0_g1_i6:233-676(+)
MRMSFSECCTQALPRGLRGQVRCLNSSDKPDCRVLTSPAKRLKGSRGYGIPLRVPHAGRSRMTAWAGLVQTTLPKGPTAIGTSCFELGDCEFIGDASLNYGRRVLVGALHNLESAGLVHMRSKTTVRWTRMDSSVCYARARCVPAAA